MNFDLFSVASQRHLIFWRRRPVKPGLERSGDHPNRHELVAGGAVVISSKMFVGVKEDLLQRSLRLARIAGAFRAVASVAID